MMRYTSLSRKRRGAVLPMVAICLVALVALIAMAIDIGMVAIVRCQCQNAADASALAGVRSLNGDSAVSYNIANAPSVAVQAAVDNQVLGGNIQGNPATDWNTTDTALQAEVHPNAHTFNTGEVSVQVGTYAYTYNDSNPSQEGFGLQIPRTDTNEPYGAVRVTITHQGNFTFGRALGISSFNTTATAVAVHRPRDIMIIMDLSGSMRFQSLPAKPYYGDRSTSMNPETIYPEFGHYSNTSAAALKGNTSYATNGGEYYDPANISTSSNAGPAILEYFFQNSWGTPPSSSNRAFTRASDAYNTAPGGDNYLKKTQDTDATNYAKTVSEVVVNSAGDYAFEKNGYQAYRANFKGYTEGPGYWGKTFFIWPPDSRGPSSSKNPTVGADHADNGSKDWRQRFFFKVNNSGTLAWCDQNTVLFNSSGKLRRPMDTGNAVSVSEGGSNVSYTYRINYAAIFKWLADSPAPIPSILRAGRIKFFDVYPDWTDSGLNNRLWTTASASLNANERLWKGYVDFVLCQLETGAGTYSSTNQEYMIGNGPNFTWGTVQISRKPDSASPYETGNINNVSGYAAGTAAASNIKIKNVNQSVSVGNYVRVGSDSTLYKVSDVNSYDNSADTVRIQFDTPTAVAFSDGNTVKFYSAYPDLYMNYTDNPARPRHHFWFGGMTMYDYLGNYNQDRFWLPGNIPEAQAWSAKAGIQTAIDDIKNNHPNDFVGLTFFSDPRNSRTDSNGQHNKAVVALGRNYQQLKDSLWFPPTTVTGGVSEITPWDEDFRDVPRSKGGTGPGMGFMIAYNQLSSSTTNLRTYATPTTTYRGSAGGLGRKGASRVIIFETDGAPNTRTYATLEGTGSNRYYKIRIAKPAIITDSANVEWPSGGSYSDNDIYTVVDQISALDSASPPGFSTSRKPVLVYSLGYGTLFDPANSTDSDQSDALTFLQTIQYKGKTSANTTGSNFPTNQRIYGTSDERITRMRAAFTTIMQGGVQVSLIE